VCIRNEDCFDKNCTAGSCYQEYATISFAPVVSYPSSFKPYFLVSADFDGDGKVDLAVANEIGNAITMYLGQADGSFTKKAEEAPTGEYPTGLVVTDFNHDGKLDLATANFHGDDVTVLLGDGTGRFAPPAHYAAGGKGAETANLALGDFNGDGTSDIVATNPSLDSLSVFLGRPDGTMGPQTPLLPGGKGAQPFSVTVGDFNRDGKADIAAALTGQSSVHVYLGTGDGTFRPDVAYPAGAIGPYFAITADLDVNGVLDIVLADRNADSVSVLLGKGDGTFRAAVVSSTGAGTGPYSLAVIDLNKDGVPDIVTTNYQKDTVSLLLGKGDGRFREPIHPGSPGKTPYCVTVGDFNGDGKSDLATANAISNDVGVMLNTSR